MGVFLNLHSILKIFKKKMTLIAHVFFNLRTPKNKFLKSPVSEDPSTSNMVNEAKYCSKRKGNTFTIFIDHSEGNSV